MVLFPDDQCGPPSLEVVTMETIPLFPCAAVALDAGQQLKNNFQGRRATLIV